MSEGKGKCALLSIARPGFGFVACINSECEWWDRTLSCCSQNRPLIQNVYTDKELYQEHPEIKPDNWS